MILMLFKVLILLLFFVVVVEWVDNLEFSVEEWDDFVDVDWFVVLRKNCWSKCK